MTGTPLFNPSAAIRAQLQSGYKSTDYAIAEIIDNSVEAGAKNINIFIIQGWRNPINQNGRRTRQVQRIITIDDGKGMNREILGSVLSFGYGTHINKTETIVDGFGKLGKFGYGLPNSSVATADITHVWSWQNSIDNTLHTCLNVNDIINEVQSGQSPVVEKQIPSSIHKLMQAANVAPSKSGTIVDWTNTSRCSWAKVESLINHLEETVGRIFRKFIDNKSVIIKVHVFDQQNCDKPHSNRTIRVNDPLFLMKNSIAHGLLVNNEGPDATLFKPEKFSIEKRKPKSLVWCDGNNEDFIPVKVGDKEAIVTIRYSVTSRFLRHSPYAGNSPIGMLARRLSGVSICRSGREISISQAWIRTQDSTERWWGVEIEFPPALDKMLGVTNNKQTVMKLDAFATSDPKEFLEEYNSEIGEKNPDLKLSCVADLVEEMKNSNDDRWLPLLIRHRITERVSVLNKIIQSYGRGSTKTSNGGSISETEIKPVDSFTKTVDIVHKQEDITPPSPEVKQQVELQIEKDESLTDEEKHDILEWLDSEHRARFDTADLDSNDLFQCEQICGKYRFKINSNHKAYGALFTNLNFFLEDVDTDLEKLSPSEITARLSSLRTVIALLLFSMSITQFRMGESASVIRTYRSKMSEQLSEYMEAFEKVEAEDGLTSGAKKEFN